MDLITFAYGQDVDLYRDVLKVRPDASDQDIESAFVQRRYELFNELQSASVSNAVNKNMISPDGRPISMSVRHFTEKKMDALIASYRLLSDREKRRQYNMSLSLAAAKKHNNHMKVRTSPQGVIEFKCSPTDSTSSASEESESNAVDSSLIFPDDVNDSNDSRLFTTPYNPNKGPTPTKGSDPRLNAKKRLFDSPSFASGSSGIHEGVSNPASATSSLDRLHIGSSELGTGESSTRESHGGNQSESDAFETDTENDTVTDNEYTDDGTDEGEYDDEMVNRQKYSREKQETQRPSSYHTPDQGSRSGSSRKVTWSASARNGATEQESRQKAKSEESSFSSWLRSNHLIDTADVVENVGDELKGAASDALLAFSQIFNAFVIDDEAIDSVAGNIGKAAEDLSSPHKTPKRYKVVRK